MTLKNIPTKLAAYDKKRNRYFVLAPPLVCAVKMNDVWYQSVPVPLEEIDEYYDLITDLHVVKQLVEEAKAELNIP